MRLDKFLVEMGIGSRSQVKQYVKKGTVTVNGAPVKSSDVKIDENNDTIKYNGRILNYSRYRYFLLNKPAGCVSATKDNVHQTVIDLLKGENTKGLSPVGRLDIDTEGLLLLTNDGALTHHLLSPAHHIPKTYYAEIDGYVTDDTINLFATGVDIGDEKPTLPADLRILSSDSTAARSEIELIITEGRFHQVKRMFEAVGMKVTFLRRIVPGGADDSYGIEVAKLAGIPQSVISRAKEILKDLEHGKYKNENANIQKQDNSDDMQLSLIGSAESPVIEKLKDTDINTLTPIEAMNLLYELKGMI